MNTRMFFVVSCFLFALTAASALNRTAAAAASIDVPRISVEQAKQVHGNPDVIFIDVRTAASWWRSTLKITQAFREDPKAIAQWAPKYAKSKTLILYCA